MGINGLYKFINNNFPHIYKTINIKELKGTACIIDGIQHIYNQLIYLRSKNKEVISIDGKNISHIHGLLNSLSYYLKNGILPIFIFDGKSPSIKKNKVEERKNNLKKNLLRLKNLKDAKDSSTNNSLLELNEEYNKLYKKTIVIKDYFIKDWIEILELLGLPVIIAEEEADPICAYVLNNNNFIYGIISDDSDMLIFGAKVIMKKVVNQNFTIIHLDDLLINLNILLNKDNKLNIQFTLDNLIEFCILLGSDYGKFDLINNIKEPIEILNAYIKNDKKVEKLMLKDQTELFYIIKNYYLKNEFLKENLIFNKPENIQANYKKLYLRLLELNVDENYIKKNILIFELYINRINHKNKINKL